MRLHFMAIDFDRERGPILCAVSRVRGSFPLVAAPGMLSGPASSNSADVLPYFPESSASAFRKLARGINAWLTSKIFS